MNTKKMGLFIQQLRKEKGISRRNLADKCFLESEKAIGDWENGKAIPDIDKLQMLSDTFNVSIDELLDGERRENIDFKKIYVKADQNKMLQMSLDNDFNYFEFNQEQVFKVINRINELLKIRIHDNFSNNEECEFAFLVDNFYEINVDACRNYASKAIKNPYVLLKSAIRNRLAKITNMTDDERLWELNKFIKPNKEIDFDLWLLRNNGAPEKGSSLDKRFNALSDLQKDMVLMSIKSIDPACDEDKISGKYLKRYEELKGRKFNKDEECRSVIKYLIENGACLNSFYLSFYEMHIVKKRIIDRLEEVYLLCKKPLDLYYETGNEPKHYKAKNTSKNRFIKDYNLYYFLNQTFEEKSINEWFDIVSKNEKIPQEYVLKYAGEHGINLNQDERFLNADLECVKWIFVPWDEWKKKEKEIDAASIEYKNLLKKLDVGEIFYEERVENFIGGKTLDEIKSYYLLWNSNVSYDEVIHSRMLDETKELYENLDKLTLEEIRDRYFKAEVYDDECNA